jgi:hypothetical protein
MRIIRAYDVGAGVKVEQFEVILKLASGLDLNTNDAGIKACHAAIANLLPKTGGDLASLAKGIFGWVDDLVKQSKSIDEAVAKAKAFNADQNKRNPDGVRETLGADAVKALKAAKAYFSQTGNSQAAKSNAVANIQGTKGTFTKNKGKNGETLWKV